MSKKLIEYVVYSVDDSVDDREFITAESPKRAAEIYIEHIYPQGISTELEIEVVPVNSISSFSAIKKTIIIDRGGIC